MWSLSNWLLLFGLVLNLIASLFFVFKKLNKVVIYLSPYYKNLLFAYNKLLRSKRLEKEDRGFKQLLETLDMTHKKYKRLLIYNGKLLGSGLGKYLTQVKDENIDLNIDTNLLTKRINETVENKRREYGFIILLFGFMFQVIGVIISL